LTFNPDISSSDIVASSLVLEVEVEKYFWFLVSFILNFIALMLVTLAMSVLALIFVPLLRVVE
jgi:hypothetical protein